MKTHFDQSIFPTHSENWDFSHQMFFSDQWNSAPWRPPIGNRGNRGLEHPFYGRLRCFVDSDELSKFPGKSPTELTAPPYREEWQLFVATLLFTILCSFVLPPPSQQKSICHETFLWFIHPSSVFRTVWKIQDFSVTQILREINVRNCVVCT